jgi:hypothetical protein
LKKKKRIRTICVDAIVDKSVANTARKERRSYSAQVSVILEDHFRKGGAELEETKEKEKE